MDEQIIDWTIQGARSGEKANVYAPLQHFTTKRAAVSAMDAQRMPKTPIYRVGHHYIFALPKE